MIFFFDYKILVDEEKIQKRIEKINSLYDSGNQIHFWVENDDIFLHKILEFLEEKRCKFTCIKRGKPYYDILVDDKTEKVENFFLG